MIKTVTDNTLLNKFNKDYNYCSWFSKTSSCLKKSKIEGILRTSLNFQDSKTCIDIFRENLLIISNYRISNIEAYRDVILQYADIWCGTPEIANDFINSVSDKTFYNYFSVKYIGRKRVKGQDGNRFPNNIIFDFNFDTFLSLTSNFEDMYKYETAYMHYFILIYILELIENAGIAIPALDNNFCNKFFPVLFDNINSTVLTGMEAFAEFDLGFPYVMLFDELRQLTPESRKEFTYYATPDNLSINYKIEDYLIISKKFSEYLGNAPYYVIPTPKKEKELDTATYSELRIVEGSAPNRMKVIVRLSGQRIINRLFSINGNVSRNLKTHKLHEYIYMADNFVAFTLWVFLTSTKQSMEDFKGVKISKILPYILYVDEESEHRKRGIVPKTAMAILLSQMSGSERDAYLKNNFNVNDTQQRAFIRRSILKIKALQRNLKNQEPLVSRLVKELKYVYKW